MDQGFSKTEGRDPVWSWKFRVLKAEVLLRRGNLQQTLDLLNPEPPAQAPADFLARRKVIQGEAFCRLNRLQETNTVLRNAEQLIPTDRRDLLAELALTRGRCSLSGNRTLALQYFESASKLADGGDKSVEGIALLNAGWVLLQQQRYGDAKDRLSRALAVTDSPLVREKALGNLALFYTETGDWKQSIFLAEQAEKLASQIKNISDQEKWLIDLGRAHFGLFEFSKAEPYFTAALAIARSRKDEDGIWRCLNSLTQLALSRHDLAAAESYWKEESALNLVGEASVYVSFDAAEIARERKEFSKAEDLFKEILKSNAKESLRLTTQRELGVVYWQWNKIIEADLTFREAIKNAEAAISRLPPEYQMSFLDEDPFYDSYVRFLVAEGKPTEALKTEERGRAQILSRVLRDRQNQQVAFDLTKIQAALKSRNQIALAYSLTNEESFLWVVTPQQLKLFRLPSHEILGLKIDSYNHEIVDHPRSIEESSAGQELYKALVQPAESLIPKGSRVVIISSKILSVLSFESLIVPGPHPHYWIDDVEIETASSLALLARARPTGVKTSKSKKDLLLLGAPLEADKAFPALPNASDEMNRVRSHFPANQETVISGKEAIPQSYRASNPGAYRFIHIDAHSAASELNPLDSFVVLSPSENSYKLYAHDITNTPLRAELVTLSACYGAGTRWYNGEGIVGLGWAFLRAGAHQVVASLWTVDDASTPQLMDDFYGELSKGKSAAEALRTAKLKMLHSGGQNSRPFYWASLQLYTGS